ncbi:MAG: GIY-YIG nuclease family protein [Woeseiaceae bacterium]|nr:GIY-YIG nuclease family protein [Woeseiaceae bacterium]
MSTGEYSLYIVRCRDGSLYTGIAIDVDRRLREHESGNRGARYLRGRGPLRLEFTQHLGDRATALRFEHRVKRLQREHKEALIAGRISLRELSAD